MPDTLTDATDAIIAAGRLLAGRGWVPATSGNLSARLDAERIAITASGGDKGNIRPEGILTARIDEPPPPGSSAETGLHLAAYRRDAGIGAVLHVHSRAATLISRRLAASGEVRLAGYELQKAFAGITTHESEIIVPIFANDQDIGTLARISADRLATSTAPGFLLAGHGLYAWGRNMAEALRHLEAFDFLFACELAQWGIPV